MLSDRLKKIVLRELDLDDFDFNDNTTANMVPGWDSLTHIQIIVAAEKDFKIKLICIRCIIPVYACCAELW